MDKLFSRLKKPFSAALGVGALMLYIAPRDLLSTIDGWIHLWGHEPPTWLSGEHGEVTLRLISVTIAAILIVSFLWPLLDHFRLALMATTEKNEKIPQFTYPFSNPKQLLNGMLGTWSARKMGMIELRQSDSIQTKEQFSAPVAFRLIAKTNSSNLRFGCAGFFILNWESHPWDDLRIDGGPVGGKHKANSGLIPYNEWVVCDVIITTNSMTLYINGDKRFSELGDFSQTNAPFIIFPAGHATLHIKSLETGIPLG